MKLKLFVLFVAIMTLIPVAESVMAEGRISSGSSCASVETVLNHISMDGRDKTTHSQLGNYFKHDSKECDGIVIINQNGQLSVQTCMLVNFEYDSKVELLYGQKRIIDNVFNGERPNPNYIVTELHSIDLDQNGLHDIIVEIVDVSAIPKYGKYIATTKAFYFAKGDGNFIKGESGVRF